MMMIVEILSYFTEEYLEQMSLSEIIWREQHAILKNKWIKCPSLSFN